MTAVAPFVASLVLAFGCVAPARAIVGYPDPSFGSGGAQWLALAEPGEFEFLQAVAVTADGRIVALASAGPDGEIAVARRLPDGAPDLSFGDGLGRRFVTGAAQRYDGRFYGRAMALQPDGKIVIGGRCVPRGAEPPRFLIVRLLADGSALDASFGDHGVVTLPAGVDGTYDGLLAVAVQPDGKIVAAGAHLEPPDDGDMLVMRLAPNGRIDSGFGEQGRRTIGFDHSGADGRRNDEAEALALQPDGKIVVAGTSETAASGSAAAVARLTADGNLDPTFGTYAVGRARFRFDTGDISRAYAVAFSSLPYDTQRASWRIVVAGWTSSATDHRGFGVAVLDDAGTLDTAFGGDGRTLLTFATPPFTLARDAGYAVAIESGVRRIPSPFGGTLPVPYRKIVVAGASHRGSYEQAALARLGFDGALDDGFGFGGQSLYSPRYSADGVPYYCHTVEYSIARQGTRLIVGSSCSESFGTPSRITLGRVPLEE